MESEGKWVGRIVVPLCHGGRKYGWEPCAMVAEGMNGNLVSRWHKVKVEALCHDGRK